MNDLRQQLVNGDPLAREAKLDAADAQTIRRRMLVEASVRPATERSPWVNPFAVAGALAACLLLAIAIGTRPDFNRAAPPLPSIKAAPARQMQFAAHGGTRIIWTFHQELDL